MTNVARLYRSFLDAFPFEPTPKQDLFFQMAAVFFLNDHPDELFVLKGYAGTGKTSVISALVKVLPEINRRPILLAPTGRAAKVMAGYAQKDAQTIHRKIYYPKKNTGGGMHFTLMPNKHKNAVFIVDESSMISSQTTEYRGASLLDDLIEYVYTGNSCKLILLGDDAQLPPVHASESPALDLDFLSRAYGFNLPNISLDQVMRQAESSGILHNATRMREQLESDFTESFAFDLRGFKDVVRLSDGYDIQDAIQSAYSNFSIEDTAFIVRSNKRANQYNQQIRLRILDQESEIAAGDFLMVVKNNYYWLEEKDEAQFIANGDIVEVLEIYKILELYSFRFARIKVRMIDYPNQPPFETTVILDTLHSEAPALTPAESNRLYEEVLADYADERAKYKRLQKVKANPYFNALQVKFAYAMTCHKSQGGQWNTVFIEHPYLPEGPNRDYLRWLYTAVTRTRSKLYLIGFPDEFFE